MMVVTLRRKGVEVAEFKRQDDIELDPDEVMVFIDEVGAPSVREIKEHFATNSRAVRRVLGQLLIDDEILITAYRGGLSILRSRGMKGKPNVEELRRRAELERRSSHTNPKSDTGKRRVRGVAHRVTTVKPRQHDPEHPFDD